jgi:hypothetical protein
VRDFRRRLVFDHLKRWWRNAKRAIIRGTSDRIGQAHKRLRQPVHALGDQFRMKKLMRPKLFHAIQNASFDVCDPPASASKAQKRVVIRRPRAG